MIFLLPIIILSILSAQEQCCVFMDMTPWDNQEISLDGKQFVKENVFSFAYIPIGFGRAITDLDEDICVANAQTTTPTMIISESKSFFSTTVYVEVSKPLPDEEMVTLSGSYLSKVYKGPFKNTGSWIDNMKSVLKSRNKELGRLLFYYPVCPECATKLYGEQVTVLLAEL